MYYSYEIWAWWIFWILLLVWIFPTHWIILGQRPNRETAIEILKKRLTKGEITQLEFVDMKNRIRIH